MPISTCYLFKSAVEYRPKDDIGIVPPRTRGIYVLFKQGRAIQRRKKRPQQVVYIGMARGEKSGVKGRLKSHLRNKSKLWTHFSVFEVWDNITHEQVQELEGMFRHIYQHDVKANKLNKQKSYLPLIKVREATQWPPHT